MSNYQEFFSLLVMNNEETIEKFCTKLFKEPERGDRIGCVYALCSPYDNSLIKFCYSYPVRKLTNYVFISRVPYAKRICELVKLLYSFTKFPTFYIDGEMNSDLFFHDESVNLKQLVYLLFELMQQVKQPSKSVKPAPTTVRITRSQGAHNTPCNCGTNCKCGPDFQCKKIININSALKHDLLKLHGIGQILSSRMLTYRRNNGAFRKVTDIVHVHYIGQTMYHNIRQLIV